MVLTEKTKKRLKWLINLLILLLCVWFLSTKINFVDVFNQTKKVNFLIFIFTVSLSVIRTWLSGMRWEALHPEKGTRLTKWCYFRFSMIAHLFNKIMPGALGGDIVKTLYTFKENNSKRSINVIAVFVDRTMGLVSIFAFGVIALIASGKKLDIDIGQMALLFIVSGGFLIALLSNNILDFMEKVIRKIRLFQKPILKLLNSWRESVEYYKTHKKTVLYSLSLCVPIHFLSFISFYVFSQSIGMQINFLEIVFAIAIMWLITALPISLGGVGVRELTLVWLLGLFGVPSDQAVSLSVMGYINNTFLTLIALPFLIDFRKSKVKPEDCTRTDSI